MNHFGLENGSKVLSELMIGLCPLSLNTANFRLCLEDERTYIEIRHYPVFQSDAATIDGRKGFLSLSLYMDRQRG